MLISVIKRKLRSFRLRVSKASGFELSCVLTEDVGTVGAVTVVWKKILFHSNFSVHTCVFLSQTAAFTIRLLDWLGCIPVLSAPLCQLRITILINLCLEHVQELLVLVSTDPEYKSQV